jgi:ABC-2 type transport system ATP-binding protein/lipopolysaccharide transport system ATP-binding protein
MLGLTRREIDGARDDIEEFTELGEFLKLPISTYSAGMLARLAFAVTTYMRPDILLVDEAVGAGDPVFMRKARTRMLGIADSASILVLASQSRQIIENFCNKAVLLSEGSIVLADDLREVCDRYFGPSPLPKLASDKVSVAAEKYVE